MTKWILQFGRKLPPAIALAGAIVGATVLAYYTRPAYAERTIASRPFIATVVVVVLVIALARGGAWLLDEVNASLSSRGVDRRRDEQSWPPVWQKRTFATALLVLLAAFAVHRPWDALLRGFHQPGERAFGVSAIAGIGNPWERATEMREALETWSAYSRPLASTAIGSSGAGSDLSDPNAPVTVIAWDFSLETALVVPGYFIFFGLLVVWASQAFLRRREQILGTLQQQSYQRYRRLAKPAAIAIIVAAAADLAENYLAVTLATDGWFSSQFSERGPAVPGAYAWLLGTLTTIKVLSWLIAIADTCLLGLLVVRHGGKTQTEFAGTYGAWRTLLALRVQAIVVVAFAVGLLVHEQVPDTIRRWADTPVTGALSVGLCLVMALSVWHSARWMIAYSTISAPTGSKARAWVFVLLSGVVAVLFGAPEGWWPTWRTTAPAVLVAIALLLSWPIRGMRPKDDLPPTPPGLGRAVVPRLLASAIVVILGLAVLRASSGDFLYNQVRGLASGPSALSIGLGVLLLALSLVGYGLLRRRTTDAGGKDQEPSASGKPRWRASVALLLFVSTWMLTMWALYLGGQTISPLVGAIGLLGAFFSLLTYTATSVIVAADSLTDAPAPVFRALGFKRTPVVTLVATWFVLASFFPVDEAFYDLRPSGSVVAREHPAENLTSAFAAWRDANCLSGSERIADHHKPAVPLVLVAAAGGGIRAAVWTSMVLDRTLGLPTSQDASLASSQANCRSGRITSLDSPTYSHWVFAMSGVSGGSLGLATYASQLSLGPDDGVQAIDGDENSGWIPEKLGQDFLAPSFAWLLFAETPWSLLRFGGDRDRAEVLEDAWTQQWNDGTGLDQGIFQLRESHPRIPLLIFNGSSVESGCRFQTSVLDLSERSIDDPSQRCLAPISGASSDADVLGATVDAVDFLCDGQDLTLAKSAMLSARFPVISPAARVVQCEALGSEPRPQTLVVDGGYLESSGAWTALELWSSLAPLVENYNTSRRARACIVPFFVQIDTAYGEPSAPSELRAPAQFIAPLRAVNATRGGRTAGARQEAEIAFDRPFSLGVRQITTLTDGVELGDRYTRFALFTHPGPEAPLGWTLSNGSMRDLESQLSFEENVEALEEFRSWFTNLRCSTAGT